MGSFRRQAAAAALLGLVLAESAAAAELRRRGVRPKADPALSARCLPARLTADDAFQAQRFRSLALGFRRDSTRHFTLAGRSIEVTHDLLAGMASGAGGGPGSLRASGFAALLALRHGLRMRSGGPAHAAYVPDDGGYLDAPQWGLRNEGKAVEGRPAKAGVDIGMERVWDRFAGADTLVVAVLDAGWAFDHPEFAGRHWVNRAEAAGKPGVDDDGNGYADDSTGWDFVDGDARPQDRNGHGAFVSGVIAAAFDDGRGMAGMLAQGKVMPVRVLDAAGAGDQDQIAEGIRYALDNGAHVINFSIGGPEGSPALKAAFQEARDRGVPIVGAAGNAGLDVDGTPVLPASFDFENLVVVGSHGPTGAPSSFSNHGTRVHLSAPGEFVFTCGLPDRKTAWSEDFEDPAAPGWTFSGGIGVGESAPLEGARSLVWTSGGTVTAAMASPVDLTGLEGATVSFQAAFTPADPTDVLILEGLRSGSALWREVAVVAEALPAGSALEFALRGLEGGQVRLRFRTSIGPNRNPAGRVLRIDGLALTTADPSPATHAVYAMVDGTSLAAPHVTAYVALQRLACDRLGMAWTRERALQGIVADPLLAGNTATGGRLHAGKGLEFYLSTLPALVVRDSTALSWTGGQRVEYALEVVTPAQGTRYRYQASGLTGGLVLDTAQGRLSWLPPAPGSYSLKLLAEGPTQLRRRLDLQVLPALPVPLARPSRDPSPGRLRLGGVSWRLPEGFEGHGRLEIASVDAAGRIKILKTLRVTPEILSRDLDFPETRRHPGLLRVRLDGSILARGN